MSRSQDNSSVSPTIQVSQDASCEEPAPRRDSQQPRSPGHVRYALNVDTNVPTPGVVRSDTAISRTGPNSALSPILRRRFTRAATFKTVEDFEDFDPEGRPGWHPGAEPGIDPSKPDGGHGSMPTLQAPCEILVVDFSQENMVTYRHDNDTLMDFIAEPQPDWAKCRWINVNGLSWDVIQILGQHKRLHKLAVEDVMNTKNRTKTDWYSNHAFIVLTLQKLVHILSADDLDMSDSDDGSSSASIKSVSSLRRRVTRMFERKDTSATEKSMESGKIHVGKNPYVQAPLSEATSPILYKSAHGLQATPNDSRARFIEKHSALAARNLAVSAEQVSIFITSDNTIISFFEFSAPDIEEPILKRLGSPDTILRQSCDASMVAQAIIDAIIDLAMPVTSLYSDVIADLEIDVLTQPNMKHTKMLYVLITEINKILHFITPITTLITTLQAHKVSLSQSDASRDLQDASKGVIITPMTHTYLGDVYDHCILISDSLTQTKVSAEGMIDLIFNTIAAYQNQTVKILTSVTILFLPMTFITGYFGQNFKEFTDLDKGIPFFWMIAAPTAISTLLLLMSPSIWDWLTSLKQRYRIRRFRARRKAKDDKRRYKYLRELKERLSY